LVVQGRLAFRINSCQIYTYTYTCEELVNALTSRE
jgi:hypothetical protein